MDVSVQLTGKLTCSGALYGDKKTPKWVLYYFGRVAQSPVFAHDR